MQEFVGYQNIKKLAEGRDRVVYSALRASDSKPVILKALRSEHPTPDMIALMYHEYEIAKDLDFPGVIRTYSFIDEQNQYALVQEDMHGISLADYLQKIPLRDLSLFLHLAIQMTRVVGELHKQHIIHKDIKPSNFIIDPKTLTEKITDFNYSTKLMHEVQEIVPPLKLEGTLSYMAPEQTGRMNMNIDYRSDFYALGITFYEMLMGELPFIYSDPLELLHAHLANPIPELSNGQMEIPPVVADIVKKLMSKNPIERYQSAIGLLADLQRCEEMLKNEGKIESFPLGQQDVFDRLNLSQKLYGREEESKVLLAAYDRVSQGAIEGLMVCGYSGIGKTMLINEVHKPMVNHKGYFINGKFDQLQRDMPYTAITQALNQLARLILAEPDARFEALKKGIISALGGVAQVIIDLAPDIELIIGPQPALEKLPPQESQNRMKIFFKRFLRVVANRDHPLVIFIDDLQWVDSGSLTLFEYLMADEELSHILFIGAYRENEVQEGHQLRKFFEDMKAEKKVIRWLPLAPLSVANYSEFLQDSFHRDAAFVQAFSELLHKRTDGNPFFCKQMINYLYREKLISFNYELRHWEWDLANIATLKITDNVVDLMLGKLATLPTETLALLKYAACAGNRFTIETLMVISGKSADEIGKKLWPALQQDLIITLRLGYKRIEAMSQEKLAPFLSRDITYQFIHDRVHQAVYQGISEEERQRTHLRIARLLLEKEPEASKKERLFEVTDHFNQAHKLLNEAEKFEVANLNYRAEVQARNSNAYHPMSNYLKAALDLLDESSWSTHYELVFKINCDYALSLFLLGKIEEAEVFTEKLLGRARTTLDKVALYRIQILSYNVHGDLPKLFEASQQALALLGVPFSISPSGSVIFIKLMKIRWNMRKFHVELLDKELPNISDTNISAAFDILLELFYPSYFSSTQAYIYLNFLAFELMLRYGKPKSAGIWVMAYGFVMLTINKNVDIAIKCQAVAERLFEVFPNKYISSLAYMWMGYFLTHLRHHFKEGREYAHKALQDSLESGNIVSAFHCRYTSAFSLLAEARSLEKTISSYKSVHKIFLDLKVSEFTEASESDLILLESLALGLNDRQERLAELERIISLGQIALVKILNLRDLCFYYYFMGSLSQALKYHYLWYAHEDKLRFDPLSYDIKGLGALALAKFIPTYRGITQWRAKRHFRRIVRELKWISDENPGNYLHHYLFLKATEAKLKGNNAKAIAALNRAIENAKKGNFYLWAALGNELACEIYIEKNQPREAIDYIREAHYFYELYGMMSKVRTLEQRYPHAFTEQAVLPQAGMSLDTTSSSFMSVGASLNTRTTSAGLDFMSVIKANQTISGEIVLDKLLEKMLHLVVESAGAEKAFFLEKNERSWAVVASLDRRANQEQFTMLNTLLESYGNLPRTVIQFALRTKETIVLNHATEDNQYRHDPYIERSRIKSILCLPVLRQERVLGIIYLENNLTIGAFTQDRLAVLSALTSQIAISLENAKHFEVMDKLFRSTERFVPKAFLNLLKKETIEDIKVGDSVEVSLAPMFADIRNFTPTAEALGSAKTAFLLNSYMQKMAPIIRRHHGFVSQFFGDGIMALFSREHRDALDAAIEMRAVMPEFNEVIKSKGYDPIEIGIGINAGTAMLITLGEEERIEPSVVSDVVNSAARIEGLNKVYGTNLLFSDAVYNAIRNPSNYLIRLVDKVKVKGKKKSMMIYEVMLPSNNEPLADTQAYINIFQEGFRLYEAGEFKRATEVFAKCLSLHSEDYVAGLLQKRCESFMLSGAPSDWDGSYSVLEK